MYGCERKRERRIVCVGVCIAWHLKQINFNHFNVVNDAWNCFFRSIKRQKDTKYLGISTFKWKRMQRAWNFYIFFPEEWWSKWRTKKYKTIFSRLSLSHSRRPNRLNISIFRLFFSSSFVRHSKPTREHFIFTHWMSNENLSGWTLEKLK